MGHENGGWMNSDQADSLKEDAQLRSELALLVEQVMTPLDEALEAAESCCESAKNATGHYRLTWAIACSQAWLKVAYLSDDASDRAHALGRGIEWATEALVMMQGFVDEVGASPCHAGRSTDSAR